MTETITLDPHEFVPSRVELGLEELGLGIMGEPDWGDAEQDLFLIRKEKGEIPTDRHPPNRTATIQLMALQKGGVNLSQAALKLQKKIGILQAEGGFVRRDLDPTDGFPNAVATRVHGANLGGIQGWMMAHRHKVTDITLTLVTDPYFYGVNEKESAKTSVAAGYELKWEMEEVQGTVPGLMRVTVKNEDTSPWRAAIAAIESRDNPQDATAGTTADLAYAAIALTKETGTTEAERETIKVVRKEKMAKQWQAIVSSKITGVGHMTHIGARRMWARIWDGFLPGEIEMRLEWRALGANTWIPNAVVTNQGAAGWTEVDLGEARPEEQVVGSRKWEWRIMARGTVTGTALDIHRIWPLPVEQECSVVKKPEISPAGVYLVRDTFIELEGNLSAKKEEQAAREWETSGSATDFTEKPKLFAATRSKATDAVEARKALVKTAEITDGIVQMTIERPVWTSAESTSNSLNQTLISRGTLELNARSFTSRGSGTTFVEEATTLELKIAGVNKTGVTLPIIQANVPYVLTLMTVGEAAFCWINKEGEPYGEPDLAYNVGAVAKGRVGFSERASLPTEGLERRYKNFYVWEIEADALCYAGRSIDFRSDGVYRQGSSEDIWARLIPDGFLFYAPPSGLEARKAKGVIIPSFGNLAGLMDKGPHSLSAIIHHYPGYHFTP